jgi:DNA-binding transcriptional LysR family regulator
MLFRKLEYLVALAKEGHFGRAASACQISQPTLSAALRQLETEMGALVVKRGKRYQGLTENGERVLRFAQKLTSAYSHLRQDLESHSSDSAGILRVGAIPSAMPVVSKLAILFHKQYPESDLRLMELSPADIRKALETFTLDIAVLYMDEKLNRQVRAHTLYTEQYVLVLRKDGAPSMRKSITWREVSRLSLCMLAPEMLGSASYMHSLINHGERDPVRLETNSITALRASIARSKWPALVPVALANELRVAGNLLSIALPALHKPDPIAVVIPFREFAPPLAEAFFEIAVSATSSRILKRSAAAAKRRK